MKIVGVAACITGIAHTYMAQEALEKECKKRGFDCKVETQGGMGIENELEQDEIDDADVVEGEDRFEEKDEAGRVLTLNPADLIRDPAATVDKAIALVK